jgi:nitrate/TMAO reductase-like tetraheme cytochrome c subunit
MRGLLAALLFLALATPAAAADSVCLVCHSSNLMKPEFRKVYQEWKESIHAQNNVSCNDCHGGDPKDATNAMLPQRGFLGVPKPTAVPEFCGKCHIAIAKDYLGSDHGKALMIKGTGPNCVTCHGAHNVQKAQLAIINETLCSKCHSYERAQLMKEALFGTEGKINTISRELQTIRSNGLDVENEARTLFRTQAQYRALFHTVDVNLVKSQTDSFNASLDALQKKTQAFLNDLGFRKNFAGFLLLLFAAMGVVAFLLSRIYNRSDS